MYKYGMRLRPFSLGCQPKKGLVAVDESDDRYWNVLYYNRPLTTEEVQNYELDLISFEDANVVWKVTKVQ